MRNLSNEFERFLDECTTETPLQNYLTEHPQILERAFDTGEYYPTVLPKFRLGAEYETDFTVIGHRSNWAWNVTLIEIEPPNSNRPLLNKKGQTTARLKDAENQIKEWQVWMKRNDQNTFVPDALNQLKKLRAWDREPKYYEPSYGNYYELRVIYKIVIGRRSSLTNEDQQHRRWQHNQAVNSIEIVSWDRLLDRAREIDRFAALATD